MVSDRRGNQRWIGIVFGSEMSGQQGGAVRPYTCVCCSCKTFRICQRGCESTLAALFFWLEAVGNSNQIAQTEKRHTS
jgi:hypothetical protein